MIRVTFAPVEGLDPLRADVVIAQRISLFSPHHLETVKAYCQHHNGKFVYDLDDDLLALGPDHTQSDTYDRFKPVVRRALSCADQIWASTDTLAERCREFARDVVTVPNTLDPRIWSPPSTAPKEDGLVRFLFMGTPTHRHDFEAIIAPAFSRLHSELSEVVRLTVIGVTDRASVGVPCSIVKVPEVLALSYPAFAGWLQSVGPFDVGLAPLMDTRFNRAKSNIKQLEYAALGLPTIASRLPPYSDTPSAARGAILVEPTPEGFYRAMRDIVSDTDLFRNVKAAARQLAAELLAPDADREPRVGIIRDLLAGGVRKASSGIRAADSGASRCLQGRLKHTAPFRSRAAVTQIDESGLFDAVWYLQTYPDVAAAGMDPLAHYLVHGGQEHRDPGPFFDTSAYLMHHPDVAATSMNALLHYVTHGRSEGRIAFPVIERSEEYIPPLRPDPVPLTAFCVAFYFLERQPRHESTAAWAIRHAKEREQARRFGISAFCYHLASIGTGGRADERLAIVARMEDDFRFCICLAGLAASSELDFADRFSPILLSRNYLRVEGGPVVVIHHAAPAANARTAARQWRGVAGCAPLLLICHSHIDPVSMGFDAALDTPAEFDKYQDLVRRSYDYPAHHSFQLIPRVQVGSGGLCERPAQAPPLQSSVASYQEWLENVCRSMASHDNEGSRLVFIDGWNAAHEAEGLHPTPYHGYAYLNATARALQSATPSLPARNPGIAVVAHVFYADLWPEIAARLRTWDMPFRLFASVPEAQAEEVGALIRSDWPDAHVTGVANRGRDMAPFLQHATRIAQSSVDYICKVHTKKSRHRADGDEWRQDLYAKLLGGSGGPAAVAAAFRGNAALGIMAPEGHIIPGEPYWGANAPRAYELATRMGYPGPLTPFSFVAGSMFWIRSRALQPLLSLNIQADDFEEESGQVDGTLAHALERLIPIAARIGGYRLADTRILREGAWSRDRLRSEDELAYLQEQGRDYRFAPPVSVRRHVR